MYPGVYVNHHATPEWHTRAVAALSYTGSGAALSHAAAGEWWFAGAGNRGRSTGPLMEVSIPFGRTVLAQPGLTIHRRRVMPAVWAGTITATAPADTALDLVARAESQDDVVGILTRAARVVRPGGIRQAATGRSRLRHRALVNDLLGEVDAGIESPLELRYHRDVERAHRLPRAELQVRERLSGSWIRADCRYRRFRVRVELDGRLAHPRGRTDADTWRDNAALLATSEITLRYRWRHVAGDPCRTALQVLEALRRGGWAGQPRSCRPGCPLR